MRPPGPQQDQDAPKLHTESSTRVLSASSLARLSDRASGAGRGWWDAPWRIRRPCLQGWRARLRVKFFAQLLPSSLPSSCQALVALPRALGQLLPALEVLRPLLGSSPRPAHSTSPPPKSASEFLETHSQSDQNVSLIFKWIYAPFCPDLPPKTEAT